MGTHPIPICTQYISEQSIVAFSVSATSTLEKEENLIKEGVLAS